MNSTPIFLLNFFKKVITKIDCHFILKHKENFQVFTSKPLPDIKCHQVSDINIKGKEIPQYLADNVHKFDSSVHGLSQTKECYNDYRAQLDPFIQRLESISNNNDSR